MIVFYAISCMMISMLMMSITIIRHMNDSIFPLPTTSSYSSFIHRHSYPHLLFMMIPIRNMSILRSHKLFLSFCCVHHCYSVWTGLLSCSWCGHSSKFGQEVGVVNLVKNLPVVVGKRATTSAHQAGAHPLKCPHALKCSFF